MNRARRVAIAVALVVLLVGSLASYLTRGVMEHLSFLHGAQSAWTGDPAPHGIVDQRPWQTAETLAGLAVSAEEKELAREAERLADHEVDQAFSQSLRQASAETRQLKGEALRLQQRVTELQQTVKDDQAKVAALSPKTAPGDAAPQVGDDLDVAKAQLGLDQNELADSLEDLARESGDQRVKIQQELNAREAAMKKYDAAHAGGGEDQTAVEVADTYKTLAGQIAAWRKQRTRMQLLAQAEQLAQADVAALTGDHDRLEAEAKATEASAAAAKAKGESGAEQVKQLQYMAGQRNVLSIVYDRLGAQQQLAALYLRWAKQVQRQHRIVLHLMLQSVVAIAWIALGTILVGWGLQLLLERMSTDLRQKRTMRTVLNLGRSWSGCCWCCWSSSVARSRCRRSWGLPRLG